MRSFAKLPDRNTDAQPDVTLAWRTAPPQKILVHPVRSMMADGGGIGASSPNHTSMTRAYSATNAPTPPTPVLSPPVIRASVKARPLRVSGSAKQILRRRDAGPPSLQPQGEAGKLKSKTGAKRLKRSQSPYTRRTSLPSDQDLLESHVANHYDEKAPELDSAFSLPQAVYPKPARRSSSGGIKRLLGDRVMTIESKGTQATLHSRALRDTREPEPEPFNMRALVRELQVPGSAGSADSGTSSLGPCPTATFTFRAMPRGCRSSEPTTGSAKAEVLTLPDIRPARVPGVMKRRSRSGAGTSCNFSRMIRSSTESIDSLTGAIELQRPSTGRRQRPGSAPGHGRRHRPVSAPSRPRHIVRPVPDLVLERPTTGESAEAEFLFPRSAAFDFSQISRPYSNESHTRSDIGSSIQGSTEGSRPSTAADEESLVDFETICIRPICAEIL